MSDKKTKLSNPKDIIGCDKIPFHLWPETATIMGSLGLLDGMLKYGRHNWRESGVRASIYIDAVRRHITAWFEGEDNDPDSGLPHMAHALACLAIIVDSEACGNLNDDRMFPGNYRKFINKLTPYVKRLKELHKDKSPHHWTIKDKEIKETPIITVQVPINDDINKSIDDVKNLTNTIIKNTCIPSSFFPSQIVNDINKPIEDKKIKCDENSIPATIINLTGKLKEDENTMQEIIKNNKRIEDELKGYGK